MDKKIDLKIFHVIITKWKFANIVIKLFKAKTN